MEVKTILIILILNIALPTLDTFTDIILVVKLYRGAHYCDYDGGPDYKKCEKDPVGYCSNDENNQNFCRPSCKWAHRDSEDQKKCRKDPVGFCSNDENNQDVCQYWAYCHYWAFHQYDDYKKC